MSRLSRPTPRRRPTAAQVRIVGGIWKRTVLPVLDAEGLRPTPDRVRETLFNWLGQRLDGQRCLDLFAGSGALGFESASRGASEVVLVERNRQAARQLEANRQKLDASAVRIVEADALRFAQGLAAHSFDVIFLDPPFGGDALAAALPLAMRLARPDGAIYVEAPASLTLAEETGWRVDRSDKAGAVHYHLLRCENSQ
ncbi:16S rRNA (guanine(966)-N(2))-methyltransferase RsmD [Chitinasiproducens palmae]|uniref:16S rRNA (Guanine(966)-N(2))-methyltransferase RsmD n=2 Tax=Chitinasiproducens palmae TaxID=1770053 RepID=A0A1H2PNG2_9BURK|nr:16S rRNA (guanine(966)-N(2))-methyltransferase RsmD [Chitinasiproducens palmae]SDV48221.1 16S rRNA (guanine(966)-N(2))-methyltransferase RsmD [Chitinasiproducens palmae]